MWELLSEASGTLYYDKDADDALFIYCLLVEVDLIFLLDRTPKLLPWVRSP